MRGLERLVQAEQEVLIRRELAALLPQTQLPTAVVEQLQLELDGAEREVRRQGLPGLRQMRAEGEERVGRRRASFLDPGL